MVTGSQAFSRRVWWIRTVQAGSTDKWTPSHRLAVSGSAPLLPLDANLCNGTTYTQSEFLHLFLGLKDGPSEVCLCLQGDSKSSPDEQSCYPLAKSGMVGCINSFPYLDKNLDLFFLYSAISVSEIKEV